MPLIVFALGILLVVVVTVTLVLPRMSAPTPQTQTGPAIHVNPIAGLRPDFIMGADVSMLPQIEASGGKYYDNGVAQDGLKILKSHGLNWVRLRIWNDPTDANGAGLGGGNNDLDRTVALAVRARGLGLKILLDFHYSDWWADPSTQTKPRAWAGLNSEQLRQAVYDYTALVIHKLDQAGAMPDMVQIGNEINGGLIWPDGKTWKQGSEQVGGYDGLAALLAQGARAVRDNDPNKADPAKRARIVIHLANGGDNGLYHTVFDELTKRNVDFDVIGLSYYPYWHGTLDQLKSNMNDVSARYHKDVVVAETAYAYTLEDGDALANLFGEKEQSTGGYRASVQGQATAVRDIMEAVAQVPNGRGLGIFFWEPDWIPVPGAGWKAGEGDAWENQAMFDVHGNALPSLNVFELARPDSGSAFVPATLSSVYPAAIKVSPGQAPDLPATVSVLYSDDSIRSIAVKWSVLDPARLAAPGTFSLDGSLAGSAEKAVVNITVAGDRNYLENPGFETGKLAPWTVEGSTSAVDVSSEAGNIHQGIYALHYWLDNPFAFTVSQTVTGLEDGTYTLSAWVQGGGGEKTLQLLATGCGSAPQTVGIMDTGWQKWQNPTIPRIVVSGGQCTIALKVVSDAGNWAFIDEVVLSKSQ